jgi:hypothetical protein
LPISLDLSRIFDDVPIWIIADPGTGAPEMFTAAEF